MGYSPDSASYDYSVSDMYGYHFFCIQQNMSACPMNGRYTWVVVYRSAWISNDKGAQICYLYLRPGHRYTLSLTYMLRACKSTIRDRATTSVPTAHPCPRFWSTFRVSNR